MYPWYISRILNRYIDFLYFDILIDFYWFFRDTKHLDQCDIPCLVPHFMDRIVDRNFRMNRISHNVAVAIHREIISQYFRKFHEGKNSVVCFSLVDSN